MKYICYEPFSGKTIGNTKVYIPKRSKLEGKEFNGGTFLIYNGSIICTAHSECGKKHFSRNDDGNGLQRGKLATRIVSLLTAPTTSDKHAWKLHDTRWDKIWNNKDLYQYNLTPLGDHWTWNDNFYAADIVDLENILKEITAK